MIKLKHKIKVHDPNRLGKAVTQAVDKRLWDAMEKVQNKTRKVYLGNVSGYARLPKFLKMSRDRLKSGDVRLKLEVSAAEGKRRGADITHAIGGSKGGGARRESITAWDSIAYQIEHGTTRSGSKVIRHRGQLMSIPIHPDAKDKSPRDFPHGKWIELGGFRQKYFVVVARGGSFHKAVPGRKAKQPFKGSRNPRLSESHRQEHLVRDVKYKFLFVGKHEVPVRMAKPYWGPTLKTMFGDGLDAMSGEAIQILKRELGEDFEVK